MIVANFYHLKNTNGLFYYGVDYLGENLKGLRKVLVRPELCASVQRVFPGVEVVACNSGRLVIEAVRAALRGDFVYAPSSHPLPFLSNQMVVVHDVFPMYGRLGRIKKFLLSLSLASSRCRVGYINNSVAGSFTRKLGVPDTQLIFAPNKFPAVRLRDRDRKRDSSTRISVGLFGTDSSKKNYDALFSAVLAANASVTMDFVVYGHSTQYYQDLVQTYPDIRVELVESDCSSLDEFFSRIDLVVSVAEHEGFGRPIAAALLAEVPCLLVEGPVFVEFFQDAAEFAPDVATLVKRMITIAATDDIPAVSYAPPVLVVEAYHKAVAYLQARASVPE